MRELVIACPGSGKTRKLVERVNEAIASGIAIPEYCYAITFTREAAAEMKARFASDSIHVSTIHSLAYMITHNGKELTTEESITSYDELLREAIAQLKHPVFSMDIDLVALDEAQDLNALQFELVSQLIERAPFFVAVGDPMQSIYSFNGSNPEYMQRLALLKPDVVTTTMTKTYRTRSKIVEKMRLVFPDSCIEEAERLGGAMEVERVHPAKVHQRVTEILPKIDGSTAILFRTNAEIARLVRNNPALRSELNYTVPLSSHPIVSLATFLKTRDSGLDPQTIYDVAEFVGYGGWKMRRNTDALKLVGSRPITLSFLNDTFRNEGNLTHEYPILPGARSYMRNFLETFESLGLNLETITPGAIRDLIDLLGSLGFVIDNFWSFPHDALADAADRRCRGHLETYYQVSNASDRTVMTMHASKGREFKNVVVVVNPFIDIYSPEEVRVHYVAVSRAEEYVHVIIPDEKYDDSRGNVVDYLLRASGII